MASNSLRDRAAALAAEPSDTDDTWPPAAAPGSAASAERVPPSDQLQPIDAPEGIDADPEHVPVQTAINRVMRDLGKVAKADWFSGGNAGTYSFRGVDRVVNACAPVMRKHGVFAAPETVSVEYRDIPTKSGGRSHECVVVMRYHFHGPAGDTPVPCTVAGEALDTSDKATSKAQSVAWRTCLIQMFAIPTGDPDPDSVRIERGEHPLPKPADYRDEITDPRTSLARLRQIRHELRTHNLAQVAATNETGDDEPLLAMCERIGQQRRGAGEQ